MGIVTVSAAVRRCRRRGLASRGRAARAAVPRPGDRCAGRRPAGRAGVGGRGQRRDRRAGAVATGRLAGHDARPRGRGAADVGTLPDARAYREQTERVLEEIADGAGGVVLGRAGALVLGDRPDALHVRLDGPRDRRLKAAVARSGRSADEVRREMEANDRTREAYVRHFYRCDPGSAQHYHLVVDSDGAAAGDGRRTGSDGGARSGHR